MACFSGAAVLRLLCCCASAAPRLLLLLNPVTLVAVRSAATAHPWAVDLGSCTSQFQTGCSTRPPPASSTCPHPPRPTLPWAAMHSCITRWHHPPSILFYLAARRSTAAAKAWTSMPIATAPACTTISSPILTPVRPNRTAHCSSMCMPSPTWLGLLAASMSGCCSDDD